MNFRTIREHNVFKLGLTLRTRCITTQSVVSRQKCSGEVYYSTTAFSTYHGLLAQSGRPDERTHFPFPGHCNRGCEHREPFLCVNVVTTDFRYIYFALKLRNKIIITYFPFQCNATYVFKQTKLQNIPASKSNKKKKTMHCEHQRKQGLLTGFSRVSCVLLTHPTVKRWHMQNGLSYHPLSKCDPSFHSYSIAD